MRNKILTVLTIVATFFGIVGGLWKYDSSLAKAEDILVVQTQVQLLQQEFKDEKEIRRTQVVQERLWTIAQRYPTPQEMPMTIKEEKHNLEMELWQLQNKRVQ